MRSTMTTPTPRPQRTRALAIATALVSFGIVAWVAFLAYRWRTSPDVTVGVEGTRVVEIAGPQLSAAHFTPGDALAVRIADVRPVAGGFRYDLRYMAFGPGAHDIGKSLRRPDGTPPEARSEFAVSVAALIPEKYSGELYATPNSRVDLHSNHTLWMRLAWGSWALMLVPLMLYVRKKRRRAAPPERVPTIPERLRSLLERGARQDLTIAERADLEQLLLAFWSKRLNLSTERLSETVEQLRRHPQAGMQWASVERWFHSRAVQANGAVAKELLNTLPRSM